MTPSESARWGEGEAAELESGLGTDEGATKEHPRKHAKAQKGGKAENVSERAQKRSGVWLADAVVRRRNPHQASASQTPYKTFPRSLGDAQPEGGWICSFRGKQITLPLIPPLP